VASYHAPTRYGSQIAKRSCTRFGLRDGDRRGTICPPLAGSGATRHEGRTRLLDTVRTARKWRPCCRTARECVCPASRGRSSVGRAPQSHCGGQGFKSPRLHQGNQKRLFGLAIALPIMKTVETSVWRGLTAKLVQAVGSSAFAAGSDPKLLWFARRSHDELSAGVETTHPYRGIQLA
jgi:hypothetical protein